MQYKSTMRKVAGNLSQCPAGAAAALPTASSTHQQQACQQHYTVPHQPLPCLSAACPWVAVLCHQALRLLLLLHIEHANPPKPRFSSPKPI
jgi:hypothetical protein